MVEFVYRQFGVCIFGLDSLDVQLVGEGKHKQVQTVRKVFLFPRGRIISPRDVALCTAIDLRTAERVSRFENPGEPGIFGGPGYAKSFFEGFDIRNISWGQRKARRREAEKLMGEIRDRWRSEEGDKGDHSMAGSESTHWDTVGPHAWGWTTVPSEKNMPASPMGDTMPSKGALAPPMAVKPATGTQHEADLALQLQQVRLIRDHTRVCTDLGYRLYIKIWVILVVAGFAVLPMIIAFPAQYCTRVASTVFKHLQSSA